MYFLGFCALIVVASAFSLVAFFDPFITRPELSQSAGSSPSPTPKPSPAGSPGTGSALLNPESLVSLPVAEVSVADTGSVLPAHDTPVTHSHYPAIVHLTAPKNVQARPRALVASHEQTVPIFEIGS